MNAARRHVPVLVTRRFERAVEALLNHYEQVRHLHPDAGSQALRLIELVEKELPQVLALHPDIGRPAQLTRRVSTAERDWLQRLAPLTAQRRLQAREWLLGEFWILYFRTADSVYLASVRHERQAEYY
jgi:hypothetical protein